MKRINKRIAKLEKDLNRVDSNPSSITGTLAVVLFLSLILGVAIFTMGDGDITGLVTFGEMFSDIAEYNSSGFYVSDSGVREIDINRSGINALTVSGTIYGEGKAAIYLEKDGKRRLVYYFIGDAGDGFDFVNECAETCYLNELIQPKNLIFDLDGTEVNISEIGFLYHTLIDFDISPKLAMMNFSEETRKKVTYTITNREDEEFALLVYVEGPLNESITLDDTWVGFEAGKDTDKIIADIELPLDLAPGRYENKIIARYVPRPGTPFRGTPPTSVGKIIVFKDSPELRSPRPLISITLVLSLTVLFVINYSIYFFRFKKH